MERVCIAVSGGEQRGSAVRWETEKCLEISD